LWRHNQCGDLIPKQPRPSIGGTKEGDPDAIDKSLLGQLVNANKGKKGFTYTHYDVLSPGYTGDWNRDAIKKANEGGFTINLSADNLDQADKMADLHIAPVTVLLPSNTTGKILTPADRTVVICPVAADKLESCAVCKLCAMKDRKAIIGFPAHGHKKKSIDRFLQIME